MRALLLALLLTLTVIEPPSAAGQDLAAVEARLEAVEAELGEVQQRLDDATLALADAEAAEGLAEQRTARLRDDAADLTAVVEANEARVAQRLRSVYINGSIDPLVVLLSGSSSSAGDGVDRALAIEMLVSSDRMDREAAGVAQVDLAATTERLEAAVAEATAATERRRAAVVSLESDLAASQERATALAAERERLQEEARRAAEAAARRAAAEEAARRAAEGAGGGGSGSTAPRPSTPAPAPSSGGALACPVDSPRSFADTWGAARSGGRRHRGTDIIAPRSQTLRAIVGGTWDIQRNGRNAGLWAILRGDDGNDYWYLHLESHGVGDGARVQQGQFVGTNGDTGNARGTTPHVHFELHVGGNSPVNPYPTLRRACG